MFMFTRKRITLTIVILIVVVVGYLLFRPDLLAFQTRVIAVHEAYRNGQNLIETISFTERMESLRTKLGNDFGHNDEEKGKNFRDSVKQDLRAIQEPQKLMHFLRLYSRAMYARFASNRRDESGAYASIFFLTLERLREEVANGTIEHNELMGIKDEMNLQGTDSAEFDAVLNGNAFP